MAIIAFLLLSLVCAAVIAYPLLPGRTAGPAAAIVTDSDIAQAVGQVRRSRATPGHKCPACGRAYQVGDRFCVGCGAALPEPTEVARRGTCPQCGSALRDGDQFCAKCGHLLTGQGGT